MAVLEAFAVNVIDNRLYPVWVFSLWASRVRCQRPSPIAFGRQLAIPY